nr:hypothetical protein Iba_chr14fCG14050 [Ipomoea batatas]
MNNKRKQNESRWIFNFTALCHSSTKYHCTDNFCRNTFKKISTPSSTITNIVSNQISNHSRVTRIIFGNSLFYFSNKVSTNISSFCIYSTTQLSKKGNE